MTFSLWIVRIMKKQLVILFLVGLALAACAPEKRKADTSDSNLEIKIGRFDQDFWAMKGQDLPAALAHVDSLYPDFLPIYLERVVQFGKKDDSLTVFTLQKFFADTAVIHLYGDALRAYQYIEPIEADLTQAFRRANYFFPDKTTPHFYMHVSGLNQSVVVGEGFLSLSIDNYLGESYPLYERVGIYNYLRQNMCPEKVVPDYVVAWLTSEFPFVPRTGELMEELLYRGKILYVASVLLPDVDESVLMGYTPEQWKWCQKHESEMWLTMIEGKHLFSHDSMLRVKYLNDAPFTSLFSQESPGRAGAYIGWQIIENYMKANPDVSPLDLLYSVNASYILQQSGYDPR